MTHDPRIITITDALGNLLFVAMCPDCYNGPPRRTPSEAVFDMEEHKSNPVSNKGMHTDSGHNTPVTKDGPNLGEWDAPAMTQRAKGEPVPVMQDVLLVELSHGERRRAQAMARLEATLAVMARRGE